MKSPFRFRVLFALGLFVTGSLATLSAADRPVFRYDFSGLTPGPLHGQDGWHDYNPGPGVAAASPLVRQGNGEEPKQFVAQIQEGSGFISRAIRPIHDDLGNARAFALEFQACADGRQATAIFGVGNSSGCPPRVGILFGSFAVREGSFSGTIHKTYTADGSPAKPAMDAWYRVRSVWKYEDGRWTATLEVKNLTRHETEFTPLYFDPGQKYRSAPLGLDPFKPGKFWNVILIRTGLPAGKLADLTIDRLGGQ